MRLQTVVIIGNGKTSRANVEAILSDVITVHKENIQFAFIARSTQSEGITWAQQYVAEQGRVGVVYGSDLSLDLKKLKEDNAGRTIEFYVLWDDEDYDCLEAVSFCQENNIAMFDLTNGLIAIKPSVKIEQPVLVEMPEVEKITNPEAGLVKKVIKTDEEEEEEEEEFEDDEEELDSEDIILEGIQEIARVFAMAIAAELKTILKPEADNEDK